MNVAEDTYIHQIERLNQEISNLKQEISELKEHQTSLQEESHEVLHKQQDILEQKLTIEAIGPYDEICRSIIETAHEGMWVFDQNRETIFVNERISEILGYRQEEMLGKSAMDFMDEEAKNRFNIYSEMLLQGLNEKYEQKFIRKDGSILWTTITTSSLKNEQGNIIGNLLMLTDITEFKQKENMLHETEDVYKLLFDSMDEGYCIIEMRIEPDQPLDYRFIEINKAFEKQSTLTDAKGKWMRELRPAHEEYWFEIYRDVVVTGKPIRFEQGGKELENRWFSLYAYPIGRPEQKRVAVLFSDNTERKAMEEAIRENEERYSAAFRVSPHALILSEIEEGTIIETNTAFSELFGWCNEEVIGKSTLGLKIYANPDDRREAVNKLKQDGKVSNLEIKVRTKRGNEKFVVLSIEFLNIEKGNLMLTTFQDITSQKEAESKIHELLQLSQRRTAELTAVIESMPDAVYIGNNEGITHCNHVALKMLGANSLKDLQERIGELGVKFNVRWPDSGRPLREDELQFTRALRGETVIEEVVAINAQTGKDVYIRAADAPIILNEKIIGAVAINSDITDRKETEKQLKKANEQYELLFNSIEEGFAHYKALYDENGRLSDLLVLEINPAGAKFSAIRREDQIGMTWKHLWKDIDDQLFDIYREVDRKGEPFTFEHYSKITERWYTNRIYKIGVDQFAVTFIDITERKKAEEDAIVKATEIEAILSCIADGVIVYDKQGRIIRSNSAADKIINYSKEEAKLDLNERLSKGRYGVWSDDGKQLRPDEMPAYRASLYGETTRNRQLFIQGPANQYWISVSAAPLIVSGEHAGGVVSISDITEQKKAEEALRTSEAQLNAFFANSPAILNLMDENFCYINTDNVTPTYYGLDRETIKGKCVPDFLPDFNKEIGSALQRVIETGEPILNAEFEAPVPGRAGELLNWRSSFFRVPLSDKKWGIGVISIEVTDIKRSETKLRESEEMFAIMFRTVPIGISLTALPEGVIYNVNEAWLKLTGCTSKEEVIGKTSIDLGLIQDPSQLEFVKQEFEQKGQVRNAEIPFTTRENKRHIVSVNIDVIRFQDKKYVLSTITDITKRKLAEQKLFESEEKFRSLFENITEGVALHEIVYKNRKPVDYRFIDINHAYKNYTGLNEEVVRNTLASEIYQTPELFHFNEYAEVAQNRIPKRFETFFPELNKHFIINVISPKKGQFATVLEDITEQKKTEQELQQKNEDLTRFIYTVSHDLKSPLVTIKMFTYYLKDDIHSQDKETPLKDIAYIENAADRMGKLLEELLELSRIGRKEEEKSEVLLENVVQTAIDLVAGQIKEKKAEVMITAPPLMIYGFQQRFIQLFQNLIDNAIKFTGNQSEPQIEIGAIIDDANKEVVIFVKDNGLGIDPRFQQKLFGLFEKLDPKSSGTGVGLALVKRIVEVHGGRIWIESEGLNKGSTFYFTLERTRVLKK